MARSGVFIPLLFLFLLPGVSSNCYTGTAEECEETMTFVPGYSLVGEGIDVTTLEWSGADVVDTSLWRHPNGACTLCENRLQGRQHQRLPLAVVDWKVNISCSWELSSSVEESAAAVGRALALDVNNDWMSELELLADSHGPALAGSKSRLTSYAYQKELQDKYMFVRHEMPCVYYRLSLRQDPPLLPQFSRALRSLPPSYDSATYWPFLAMYGTHYVSQADLGGRVRQLTAIPTCRAALDGLTATEIKACLGLQILQDLGLSQTSNQGSKGRESSQVPYMEKRIKVTGGNSDSKQLFSTEQNASSFSTWMESLKASPDLVSYSLTPIHTLVRAGDPRREALKQAVKEYVAERGQRRSCPRSCPQGGQADPWDPCKCYCSGNPLTDSMCCSLKRGMARLKVHVLRGINLSGDIVTDTDAYVKFLFQGQQLQTGRIKNDNDPIWREDLDFGAVTLLERPKLEMEVWDKDILADDLLGRCYTYLKVGKNVTLTCRLEQGQLEFYYTLECGPNLEGNICHEYVPARGSGDRTQESWLPPCSQDRICSLHCFCDSAPSTDLGSSFIC
ncbi:perforin-1-like [Gopherus evgoodei]|uniref:perforin-1-like n=1 Tax=Gopherus evgoodei TaxID=1825980 RepID=UPI0011D03214|nr:perforin-1-like [Gopherus evgoodei]